MSLKLQKMLKTKKKKKRGLADGGRDGFALKLCLKGEQEGQKPAVWDGWWFSGGGKKGRDNLLTGKEE